MTDPQLKLLQVARRNAARARGRTIDDAEWRLVLRNAGDARPDGRGHVSALTLTEVGFEGVMAYLEGQGFRDDRRGPTHWRDLDAARNGRCSARQVHQITQLVFDAAKLGVGPAGVIRQAIGRRPDGDEFFRELTPAEARKVIEAFKAVVNRTRAPTDRARDEAPQPLTEATT